ncbi:MAG TPA: peptide-methionine (R)-S-oxide reductase MsrB [Ohtaekwangia sp.]|uniref:peptide-methionine (R)-S-oxide reductase MsrB n=1 Tax=Ohtaekwangia sp. TaxID=2066019 RepID=UPI002F934895
MYKFIGAVLVALQLWSCTGNSQPTAQQKTEKAKIAKDTSHVINRTDAEWKAMLTPEQYSVLREKGTDRPFTGKYYIHKDKGVYVCAACGNELFTSDMKFDSECGWPSFDKEIEGGKIKKVMDYSHGMTRTEILCGRCGSHLGHLFDDGPTLTGKRYCVNSTSLDFQNQKK